jgi:hypothetical protein
MRFLLLLLVACASSAQRAPQTPNYEPIAVEPAPPQADLYANCFADAIANHRYHRARNEDSTLLVFICNGAPALAFFDGLAERSARAQSEFTRGGETFRATNRVRHDLFGVDYCSRSECTITLNAGEFLR